MSLTNDQLGKAIVASGVMPADELKAFWSALLPEQRPKDGETFAKILVEQKKLNEFQASELLSGKNTPLLLGDYVLQAKIGAGGMGQVFRAHHRHMERMAAIKLLPPELTKDPETVKRFQREVKAAAKLSHPNIVQTFDASVQRGVWYLVMEYVDGRDLAETVANQGRLPIGTAINYIRQAARGLAFAHKNGVVHRDIKPANLLLDKEGTIKILDMGLARLDDGMAAAKDGLTQSGQVMGTVDYMAPEQAFDTRHADARADIYSLGCTLYRLLTAQNIYEGESLLQKLMAHQTKPIPVLTKIRADVPAAMNSIFTKMVAKQPADRYQTMAEVETALAKLDDPAAFASPSTKNNGGGLTGYFKGLMSGKAEPTAAGVAALTEPTAPHLQPGQYMPTIALNNPLQSTDPVSSRTIQTIRQKTPRPASGNKPPIWKRPIVMAAGLGGLALALLGIWVIIKDKDGNEVARVQMPEGGSTEIKEQPKTQQPSKNASSNIISQPVAKPPVDGEQAKPRAKYRWPLAPSKPEDIVWLQGLKGTLTLRTGADKQMDLNPSEPPPSGPVTIVGLVIDRSSAPVVDDEVLKRIATLVDLESLDCMFSNIPNVTKDGLPHLAALVNLRHLGLGNIGPRDTNPAFLGSFGKLKSLSLLYMAFSDWEPIVGRSPSLSELWLHNVTEVQFEKLVPLTRLTSVKLTGYPSGRANRDAGAKHFAKLVPWCRITVDDGSAGDNEVIIEPTAPLPGKNAGTPATRTPLPRFMPLHAYVPPQVMRWPLPPSRAEDFRWLREELQATVILRTGPNQETILQDQMPLPSTAGTIVGVELRRELGAIITDEVLKRLADLTDLELLVAVFASEDTKVTKDGLPQLATLVNLRHLSLGRIGPRETDPKFLSRFSKLENLNLQYVAYSGWEQQLAKLPLLNEMWLHNTALDKLNEISHPPKLEKLTLSGFADSRPQRDAAGEALAKQVPWCRVILSDARPDDRRREIAPTAPLTATPTTSKLWMHDPASRSG